MKTKNKIFTYITILLLFLFIININAQVVSNYNKVNSIQNIDNFDIVKKLKRTFPELRNNNELLKKIIQIISQELQKNIYNEDEKKTNNLTNDLYLIEKYNLLSDFSSSIEQTTIDLDQALVVFVGNKNDYYNYNYYLNAKKNNFQASGDLFWHSWTPKNFSIVSKTYLQFFIDNYFHFFLQETQINHQREQIEEQISINNQLESKIAAKEKELLENQALTEQQKRELQNEISYFQNQLNEQEIKMNSLKANISDLETKLITQEREIQKITDINLVEKNNLKTEIQRQKNLISHNQNNFSNLESRYLILQADLQKKENVIKAQTAQLQNQETQINHQKEQIEAQISINNQLESKIAAKEKELLENKTLTEQQKRELQNEISYFQNQLNEQEVKMNSLKANISDLEKKLSTQEIEIQKITDINLVEKNKLKTEIQRQKNLISHNQNNFSNLESRYLILQADLQKKENVIKAQTAQLQNQATQINHQKEQIEAQILINNQLESKIAAKEKELLENKTLTEQQKRELQNEISYFQNQLNEQEVKMNSLKANISDLEKKLSTQEREIQKITDINLVEKNKLKTEIQRQKNLISHNQNNFSNLESRYLILQADLQKKENVIKAQTAQLQNQATQINHQKEQIEAQILINNQLESQIAAKEKELLENQALTEQQKRELQNEISYFQNQLNEQEVKMNSLKANISDLEKKLSTQEREIQKITDINLVEKNKLKTEIQRQKNLISHNQNNFSNLESRYLILQADLQKKENVIKAQTAQLQNQATQINHQKEQIEAQILINNQLESQIAAKEKELLENQALTEQQKRELQNEINYFQNQLNEQEVKMNSLKANISDLETKLSTQEREIQKITDINLVEKNKLKTEIQRQKSLISHNQNNFSNLESRYLSLKVELQKKENVIKAQTAQLQNQTTQINHQKEQIEAQISINNQLESKIAAKEKELLENQTLTEQQKRELQNEISYFQNQLNEQEVKMNSLKANISDLEKKLSTQEREIQKITDINLVEKNKLKTEIQRQKNLISHNQNNFSNLESRYLILQADLQKKENVIKAQTAQLQNQATQINHQKEQIEAQILINNQLESQIAAKEKELLENQALTEQQKRELQNEINYFQNQLNEQEVKMNSLKANISDLETKLSTQEREIQKITDINLVEKNKLKTEIQRQKSLISHNQNNFSNLESRYLILQADLQKKENVIQAQKENMKDFAQNAISKMNESQSNINNSIKDLTQQIIAANKLKEEEKKIINNSKSPKKFQVEVSKLPTLGEVIGFREEIEQLKDFLSYLKNPNKYNKIGVRKPPKGVLLYGPPGTGKTFLAKAIAKEANLPFFALNSSDFSKSYLGEGPKLINDVFEEARKKSPSIIFIDECESVFRSRISNKSSHSDHDNMIAAFLTQTEGFKTDPKHPVFLMGATNYKDEIDSAILSRFNRHIKVDLLNVSDRIKFIKTLANSYKIDIRAYQYLNKVIEITEKFGDDTLKTQRKLIDILDQAAIKAIQKHDHLNILPVDFQFSLSTQMNQNFNWENHEHNQYLLTDLENLKEYKNIPIQHIYRDTNAFHNNKGDKYFQFINNEPLSFHQKIYNSRNQKIKIINFSKNREQIKKFYGTLNFLPDELLGFYFEDETPNQEDTDIYEATTLEEFLDIRKKNTKKIYFIWKIDKISQNMDFAQKLIENINIKQPFLKNQKFLEEIYLSALRQDITFEEIQQIVENKIKEFKNILNKKINNPNIFSNSWLNQEELTTIITEEIDQNFEKPYYSINEIEKIVLDNVYQKILEDKKTKTKNKINELLNNLQINHPWFSQDTITSFKRLLYNKNNQLYLSPLNFQNINMETICNNFENIKNHHLIKIIDDEWVKKLNSFNFCHPSLTQKKIKKIITNKIKSELFSPETSLEKINEEIQKTIDEREIIILDEFQKEMSENIEQLLIERDFYKNASSNQITAIQKESLSLIKQELKKANSNENKIKQKIKKFITNYQITSSNSLLSYFKDKIILVVVVVVVVVSILLLGFVIRKRKK
ncbi:Putative peptidase M41 cell division protein, fragment [Candidatus Phytoplasma australiense]|uniref:Putative peptidase M41 cell division protein n=1 Tax=Phytoplasma australiense TaxID=59748 RepID=B1VA84_PHYAS|nr:Putative peptidase M41 cell division protein, fragment [Candidatus Phytoplasma australiense]